MSFGDTLRNASQGENVEPKADKYDVRVARGSARDTKVGPVAEIILEIVAGEMAGANVKHLMFFNHPVGIEVNTEALVSYGVGLDKINEVEDLDDELQRIIGTKAEVGISYDNGYIRIKVHRSTPPNPQSHLTPDEPFHNKEQKPAASFASAAGAGDDSVPF